MHIEYTITHVRNTTAETLNFSVNCSSRVFSLRFCHVKYLQRTTIAVATAAAVVIPTAGFAPATISAPSIYTVAGSVFADANSDGALSFGEPLLPNVTVSLYSSAEDAQARRAPVTTTTTSALGTYRAGSLTGGTYYVSADVAGAAAVPVTVGGIALIATADIAASPTGALTATVFADLNGNGVKDASESNLNDQTVILIDVAKTIEMIDSGSIGDLDVGTAVAGAIRGNLDIGDAIHFRTSSKGAPISYSGLDAGAYVMMRSPFNLTIGDALKNTSRITALIDVISSGDPAALLDDPSLLMTSDISTTPDNEYIKKLATVLSKVANTIDSADLDGFLGGEFSAGVAVGGTVRAVAQLVDAVPAMHFAAVDRRGQGWSLTGLKLAKTNDFLFGIRKPVSVTGTVFNDSNGNGKKDALDLAEAVTLTVYTADGTVVSSVKTPSLLGSYTIDKLPYDTDLYVVLSGTSKRPSTAYTGQIPDALSGMTVVGSANVSGDSLTSSVPLTFGVTSK